MMRTITSFKYDEMENNPEKVHIQSNRVDLPPFLNRSRSSESNLKNLSDIKILNI